MSCYKNAIKMRPKEVNIWEVGSGMAKIVVAINSEKDLLELKNKADNLKIPNYLVRDAGRTEVEPGTITVCAVGPGRASEIDKITGSLDLL